MNVAVAFKSRGDVTIRGGRRVARRREAFKRRYATQILCAT